VKSYDLLFEAALVFFGLSLVSVGGTIGLLPDLHRFLVESRGVMSTREFASYVALAQAAPGPNILYVALFGYHIAGFVGAVVSLTSICAGPLMIMVIVTRAEKKFRAHPWREIILRGLSPVSIGLLATGVYTIARSFPDWKTWAMCVATFIIFVTTKWHPFWMLALGAMLGAALL
jgi:chromate transporter